MALILFTVSDTDEGPQVSVISEPPLDNPNEKQTEAMRIALLMLDALPREDHINGIGGTVTHLETGSHPLDVEVIADAMIHEASEQLN